MTTVLVAVPVIKDSRKFHLEKGRRWTVIEHILLEALAKQDWAMIDLTAASLLPRRVVLEVVIRLMRAGWVELKPGSKGPIFAATPTGRVYSLREDLPPVTQSVSRYVGYVVELFTGNVFRARDLITLTNDQWVSRRAGRRWAELPARLEHEKALPDVNVLADRLLESDEHLTRVDVQDWRPRRLFGLISVRNGEAEGLGSDVPDQLNAAIVMAATSAAKLVQPVFASVSIPPSGSYRRARQPHSVSFRSEDLITGGTAHADVMTSALARARHRVIIHSTFINLDRARHALDALRAAAQRGALIDILWGQSREKNGLNETRHAASSFKKILAECGLEDRIRVYMTSTRSHSKIILSDAGSADRWQAVLGSCNWLSSDFQAFDASIRLREPSVVSDVAFDIAEMVRPRDGQIPDLSIEMLRLGRQLQTRPSGGGRGVVRIVAADEHASVIAEARDGASERILVLSHRLDVAAKPTLLALAAASNAGAKAVERHALYGRLGDSVTPTSADDLRKWWRSSGLSLAQSSFKMHAKALAWDQDNLLVTSHNLLSADPGSDEPRQELGVYIRASDASTIMHDRLRRETEASAIAASE